MLCINPFVSQNFQFQSVKNQNRTYKRGSNGVVGNIDAAAFRKYTGGIGASMNVSFLKRIATWTTAIAIALSPMKVS
jgi:hypothetical protein